MKILSKLFAAWVTHWHNNDFFRARLKLTALYVIVTAAVLASFSGFLYYEVEDKLAEYALGEYKLLADIEEDGLIQEPFVDEFISGFEDNLVLANSVILVLVGFLGYWLAGRTLRPIEEKMCQHEQFSNDVAHEIRTPLSAMLARTESVLRKEETTEMYQKALRQFKNETTRLIALTEDLLLTTNQNGIAKMESVLLSTVIDTVVQRLKPLAAKKELSLTMVIENSQTITGTSLLLERMFENIVHNAIKFTPVNGIVTITVKGTMVTVADTGIGMNECTKQKAFDRFYTADTIRDERAERGSGLGLAIVKGITALHNATVSIDSEEENGTTVSVTFLQ